MVAARVNVHLRVKEAERCCSACFHQQKIVASAMHEPHASRYRRAGPTTRRRLSVTMHAITTITSRLMRSAHAIVHVPRVSS
jgi:hypothetical protein